MGNTIIRPSTREEWLQIRKSGIGSSEVATIMGLNPWESPYQLWRRKVGIDPPKEENFAMKAGHYLEDAVSRFWADETGCEIIKRSAVDWIIRDNDRPYLQVSPDRTYWLPDMPHNNANKGILECKTTQFTIDPEDIPPYWFCQVQYQLGVAGLKKGSLAWLSSGRNFGYVDIDFSEDFFAFILESVDRFWLQNIEGKEEPEAINAADVVSKYASHVGGKMIEVTDDVYASYTTLKDIKSQISALEKQQEECEAELKVAFGDAEALTYGGQTIATWKASKASTKFDSKRFLAEHPDQCKPYITTTPGNRRLLLK